MFGVIEALGMLGLLYKFECDEATEVIDDFVFDS